jgi:hypothetical protein
MLKMPQPPRLLILLIFNDSAKMSTPLKMSTKMSTLLIFH